MICKLCNKEKDLIKAHIYPKWLIKELYPDKKINADEALLSVAIGREHVKRVPVGVYDKNILCAECDNFLGKYDAYAKEALSTELHPVKVVDTRTLYTIPDADPIKLKNFFLSLVVRSHWAEQDEFAHFTVSDWFIGKNYSGSTQR